MARGRFSGITMGPRTIVMVLLTLYMHMDAEIVYWVYDPREDHPYLMDTSK
jgi:hypothetical protein